MDNMHSYDDVRLHDATDSREAETVGKGSSPASFMFLCVTMVLVGYGLVCMYSASYDEALRSGLNASYYFFRQTVFALLGFAAFAAIRFLPMAWIKKFIPILFAGSVVLMLLTLFTPLGVTRMGARRWIQIGPLPSFQPSELLKVSAILFFALLFSRQEEKQLSKGAVAEGFCIVVVSALLIIAQRDYSTGMMFLGVALAMLMVAGLKLRYIAFFLVGIGVPAVILLLIEPYRIRRLVSFLFPSIDPSGLNWQVNNSLQAIASGGLFGKGLGNGRYKLGLIPEVHSDFILASIAEETGVLGVLFIFVLFTLFAVSGFGAFMRQRTANRFNAYCAFGITFMIMWQALVNIAVVTSLVPPTGIPLPFFSQGGTNLFVILCECGLLYKIIDSERAGDGIDG